MKDIFGKINKAIDTITDVMVEQLPPVNETKEYRYSDLADYVKKMRAEYPDIQKFTIAIDRSSEYEGKVYASDRFIIRIVMLTAEGAPIIADKKSNDYLGTVVIAEAIDTQLNDRMGEDTRKSFKCSGGK